MKRSAAARCACFRGFTNTAARRCTEGPLIAKRPSRIKRRTPARVSANTDELYRIAFEGASDLLAVVRVSPRGSFHVESMNQSAITFFARTLPEVSHDDWMSLDLATMFRKKARFTPAQVAAALTPHCEAVRTRKPVSTTSEVCTASGERLARHMTMTPLADGRGRVTHLLYRAVDLTGLRRAEERFERLFDICPVPLSIVRLADGVRQQANAAWLAFHGRTREQAVSQIAPAPTAWADPEVRAKMIEALEREGHVPGRLVQLVASGGVVRDAVVSMTRIVWEGDECMLVATLDVGELASARREAQASSARFTKLFELSPVPIVIGKLSDGAYLAANAAWLELHGYLREELDGQTSLTLRAWTSPEDRARVVEILRREGELKAMPVKFRAKSGATIDTLYYAALIDWDGEPAIVAAPQDITELVHMRREADTQTERFKALFRLSPSPSSVTTLNDGRYLAVNSSWAGAMGYAPEEMLGRRALDLGIWPDAAERTRFVTELKARGALRQLPVRFRTRRDEIRQMLISSELIEWSGGPAILSSMNDVTDITRAGQEIRDLNESLEQKVLERTAELEAANRELESFSYSVSHDLRSPLGAINGFAHVLRAQESARLSADGDRLLGLLERDAERMALLVDGLLDFSRLGRKPVTKSVVQMADLVAGVADELRGKRDARHAQIRVGALPACSGDTVLLRQVWWNLLDNALKYSRYRDPAMVEVAYDSVAATYLVRDNGVGFDMRHAGKLFGVFERLHADSEFEGTGIGLATAARIVLRHGGRLWCDALPGEGATFYFSLPA